MNEPVVLSIQVGGPDDDGCRGGVRPDAPPLDQWHRQEAGRRTGLAGAPIWLGTVRPTS